MADSNILDPTSVDFESIKAQLEAHIKGRPDDDTWSDFVTSGAGQTIVELLAGLGTMLSFHSIGARRESSLEYAQLRSSVISLANNLDYPVNRRSSPRMTLTVNNSTGASISFDKTTPIGTYNNQPVSVLSAKTFSRRGENCRSGIGAMERIYLRLYYEFPYHRILVTGTNIDNDPDREAIPSSNYKLNVLTVNGNDVSLHKFSENLVKFDGEGYKDRVIIKTHPDGVLLLFGNGVIGRSLNQNDQVLFSYVEASPVISETIISPSSINLESGLQVTAVTVDSLGSDGDSLEKIAFLAPAYHSSKRRMVTESDYANIMMSYSGNLVSAKAQKKTLGDPCCTVECAYLFSDEHELSNVEEVTLQSYLKEFKMVGTSIELLKSTKVGLDMKMTIIIEDGVNLPNLNNDITEIIDNQMMTLGNLVKPGKVMQEVGNLSGVLQVYLSKPVVDTQLLFNQYMKLDTLDLVVSSDRDLVIDPSYDGSTISTKHGYIFDWQASTDYVAGQLIYYGETQVKYTAKSSHTSSLTFAEDSAKWELT